VEQQKISHDARPRRRTAVIVLAFLAYSCVATGHSPLPFATEATVAVPIALGAVLAVRSWRRHDRALPRRDRTRTASMHRGAILRWGALAALLIGWEAHELLSSPRTAYPTVSSLVALASQLRPVHALAFFGWLLIGHRLIEPARA